MSMDPPSFPARSGEEPPRRPAPGSPDGDVTPGISRQAAAIIEAILADPAPERAPVRDRLRDHVAAHPGHPETALAEHLLSLGSLASFPAGAAGPVPSEERHPAESPAPAVDGALSRIDAVLKGRMLLSAFQPIVDLTTGAVVGVEAFTRFVSDGGPTADWFADAAAARLGSELEFAALECALATAMHLPPRLYVALKLSPAICLDPLLPALLQESTLSPDRIVLQLTEALTAGQPAALAAALAPLRRTGVRLAVEHAGTYPDSIPRIRQLGPDILKLDRTLIAGIDTDPLRRCFGEAMTAFAEQLGATLIAEGIETSAEFGAVAGLGIRTGQGYFLGRPTTRPRDWARWDLPAVEARSRNVPGGSARS
ncbi:EAL domain-containing protein [Arthrobacter sp. PAMC25284]|uniref:EAL domain-containing protein n=1 Tax=Arthrobacter sp. PAMC25284 TaxID=2861279 RepID=UPI001C633973|nr:EAL domain-containing protein [Arthrobacter sp. PAMC25284]QYF90467.1 EAL domain-containing protein [Arthrobacter sp. PAMC25284]